MYNKNNNKYAKSILDESLISKECLPDNKYESCENKEMSFGISKQNLNNIISKYISSSNQELNSFSLSLCKSTDNLLNMLMCDKCSGIDESTVDLRKKVFGDNNLCNNENISFFKFLLDSLNDYMIIILIMCALIQIILGFTPISSHKDKEWLDGISIIFAVLVVVIISSISNYTKEKKFISLENKYNNMNKTTVIRNNIQLEISSLDIVVGDLIKIKQGCIIPTDGIVINSKVLLIDESCISGETDLIEKNSIENCQIINKNKYNNAFNLNNKNIFSQLDKQITPIVISGTIVNTGEAWIIATNVGLNSYIGKVQRDIIVNKSNKENHPLEVKVNKIAENIGKFALLIGLVIFCVLITQLFINYKYNNLGDNKKVDKKNIIITGILSAVLTSISIIVVAVPEGLPLAITLSLAFSVNKMMKDNNLVRNMKSCDTMGNIDIICTDKTGTLTNNQMTIEKIYNCINEIDRYNLSACSNYYFSIIVESLSICLSTEIDKNDNFTNINNTDKALINLLHKNKISIYPIIKNYENNIKSLLFNSKIKSTITLVKNKNLPKGARIIIKGASEIVVDICNKYYNSINDKLEILSDENKESLINKINIYGDSALRTICLAYKDITEENYNSIDEDILNKEEFSINYKNNISNIVLNDFTFICLFGLKDSLKENVKHSISKCKKAGVRVIMTTGDNLNTSKAIAIDSGIIDINNYNNESCSNIISGNDFYNAIEGIYCSNNYCNKAIDFCKCPKTQNELKKLKNVPTINSNLSINLRNLKIKNINKFKSITSNLKVLARSRPMDKFALVLGLKELNNIVSVTGDGTNDAQAMSISDVGLSMGIQGTDVAKQSSDIVILDDNFSSIVKSIMWGRNAYICIQKFIQYQLSVNFSACLLVLISTVLGGRSPLSVIQMLWINLIMDGLASVAITTQNPNEDDLLFNYTNNNNKKNNNCLNNFYNNNSKDNENNTLLDVKENNVNYSKNIDKPIINYNMWLFIVFNTIICVIITLFLYIYAPYFIKESQSYRIKEGNLIYNCYSHYPGRAPVKGFYYIISGNNIDWNKNYTLNHNIKCGNYEKFSNMSLALIYYIDMYGNTPHLTIVFNVFALYSILNILNARHINGNHKYNIFNDLHKNKLLIVIVIIELILQVLIIEFGGIIFNSAYKGLTIYQWVISFIFSFSCFVINFIIKFLYI